MVLPLERFDVFRCAILAASHAAISMVVDFEARGLEARLWPVSDCAAYQECLSEVLYKNNVTICCIPLCVKDCSFVGRDGQSRCLPGRTVLQIEQSSNAMGRDVEESDPGFRSRIEVINAVLDHCPIAPVTCF